MAGLNLKDDATHPGTVRIDVDDTHAVPGLLQVPEQAIACCVMAHGAGAGMTHPFMAAVADGLGERRIATLRVACPARPGADGPVPAWRQPGLGRSPGRRRPAGRGARVARLERFSAQGGLWLAGRGMMPTS